MCLSLKLWVWSCVSIVSKSNLDIISYSHTIWWVYYDMWGGLVWVVSICQHNVSHFMSRPTPLVSILPLFPSFSHVFWSLIVFLWRCILPMKQNTKQLCCNVLCKHLSSFFMILTMIAWWFVVFFFSDLEWPKYSAFRARHCLLSGCWMFPELLDTVCTHNLWLGSNVNEDKTVLRKTLAACFQYSRFLCLLTASVFLITNAC